MRCSVHRLGLAFLVLLWHGLCAEAHPADPCQTEQRPVSVHGKASYHPTTEMAYRSAFGIQAPVSCHSRAWSLILKRKEACRACQNGAAFVFGVRNLITGAGSEFRISNNTAQVNAIVLVNDSRVAILGRVSTNTAIITVVSLPSGHTLDSFECGWPSVSPDHRFVAFGKWSPAHFPPGIAAGAEYLAYDLTRSASYNRTSENRKDVPDPYNAGWPLYPRGAKNTPMDNVIIDRAKLRHDMVSSGLFWVGKGDRVAFVDRLKSQNSLIVANLSTGVRNPVIVSRLLSTSTIVSLSHCAESSAPSDFKAWTKEPGALIFISEIGTLAADPNVVRLRILPHPCVCVSALDVPIGP